MVYAMYRRHIKIQQSIKDREYLFKLDILYGTSITFLIPMFFYLAEQSVSVYLFTSIIAFIFYSSNSKLKFYHKIY